MKRHIGILKTLSDEPKAWNREWYKAEDVDAELQRKDKLYSDLYVTMNEEMDKLAAEIARLKREKVELAKRVLEWWPAVECQGMYEGSDYDKITVELEAIVEGK